MFWHFLYLNPRKQTKKKTVSHNASKVYLHVVSTVPSNKQCLPQLEWKPLASGKERRMISATWCHMLTHANQRNTSQMPNLLENFEIQKAQHAFPLENTRINVIHYWIFPSKTCSDLLLVKRLVTTMKICPQWVYAQEHRPATEIAEKS